MTVEARTVRVSVHAVEQYVARVRPALDVSVARVELEHLVSTCGRFGAAPDWHTVVDDGSRADRWLYLGDDVVLPVRGRVATTVLTRNVASPAAIEARHARRRLARLSRRSRAVPDRTVRARVGPPDAAEWA